MFWSRPKSSESPYFDVPDNERQAVTRELLREHPLSGQDVTNAVLDAWEDIFTSTIGVGRIGIDIFPTPQIMGFLLHELIPLRVSSSHNGWRKDSEASEKDLVFEPDLRFSTEVKTSSNSNLIYGNRSYGVENSGRGKKAKSGYYIAVNFQSWREAGRNQPRIRRVRFGWIDSTDWIAQTAETGQASSLPSIVYGSQLAIVFDD
ncbi:ScaI family restriction endonuclease [Agromyces sp. MMS17-SY077]|uniref:ScaI family restriction endonuclease n=1 Tax=Agromyces seonyuensis TaxID=2662446 RepID=A0A6I4NV34_9MICO|nr:ScaI family restriction endonuclease [Agromyces seonyuensis]